MTTTRPRILGIETDPDRRLQLEQFLHEAANADVTVAESAEAALRAMRFQLPDVIVASMLLPPREDAQIMSHLDTIDDASRPQVLVVPPLREPAHLSRARRLLQQLRRQRTAPFPLYDRDAIGARIQEALLESAATRSRPLRGAKRRRDARSVGRVGGWRGVSSSVPELPAANAPIVLPRKPVITRARRWTPAELPWVCSVHTPAGLDARVINLSRSGILIETGSKLLPGTIATVHLGGTGTALIVPARVVRSEVASVELVGVKYWIAAAFNGRLDPVPDAPPLPAAVPAMPRTLADLLVRVAAELDRGQRTTDVKTMFEQGVRRLASAHDVKILDAPAATSDRESIYFRVPSPSGSRAVLQVIFEPGHAPHAEEFTVMKAAAAAAAFVMTDGGIQPARVGANERRNLW
jgi:CheY-like chemotaxis protein